MTQKDPTRAMTAGPHLTQQKRQSRNFSRKSHNASRYQDRRSNLVRRPGDAHFSDKSGRTWEEGAPDPYSSARTSHGKNETSKTTWIRAVPRPLREREVPTNQRRNPRVNGCVCEVEKRTRVTSRCHHSKKRNKSDLHAPDCEQCDTKQRKRERRVQDSKR